MRRFTEEHENLDTELNIVPIIDCFVMLICFLLFTAAFTQLVFLEAKLASNTAAAAQKSRSELDQFRLIISLEDNGIKLTTAGSSAKKENIFIAKKENSHDFASLHKEIIKLKTIYPDRFAADIEVRSKKENAISYEHIILTIDTIRHLRDEEFSAYKLAHKKMRQQELSDLEKNMTIAEEISQLAASIAASEVAKNTDPKVLFPDVALLGMD